VVTALLFNHQIGALQSTCNFGVTGPTDESNTWILTQSFTHRTHIEIFGYYFGMVTRMLFSMCPFDFPFHFSFCRVCLSGCCCCRSQTDIAMPFQNWWSDDWISGVYTNQYTHRKHGIHVKHRTDKVGQRYPVTEAKHLLHREVQDGKATIQKWIAKKKLENKCDTSQSSCYCALRMD
jgi:hypothetical protein